MAFLLLTIGVGKEAYVYFSANILQKNEKENEKENAQMFLNANDAAMNCNCNKININNPYLEKGVGKTENGVFDPDGAISLFLEDEDEAFSERFRLLSGSKQCDIIQKNTTALTDQRIEPIDIFVANRWKEYQQIDCALQAMEHSNTLYCNNTVQTKYSAFLCDNQYRKEKIKNQRQQIGLSMDLAISQMNEMASMYSLHQKIVCTNEHIAEQREELVRFVTTFSKIPGTYINSTVNQ